MPQFVDEARVIVESGKGGAGAVSFRREKFVPRGGPDGGDGGQGGSVIFIGTDRRSTLLDFKHRSHLVASPGGPGRGKNMHGANGRSLRLEVPLGTQIYDDVSGALLFDLTVPDEAIVVAKGGKGGRGNAHFTTATRQTPDYADVGMPGQTRRLRLELKVMARVGLLGFPNAGKSTFLSRVTRAHPRIASYPFTTLHPHLGVLVMGNPPHEQEIVIADLPGLIEGAHEGKGLGTRFLKHVERTRILLHFLDLSHEGAEDPAESYSIIRRELELFDPDLMNKPERVVGTKLDAADPDRVDRFLAFVRERGFPELAISSQTGEGMPRLMEELALVLKEEERLEQEKNRHEDGLRPSSPGNSADDRNPSSVIA